MPRTDYVSIVALEAILLAVALIAVIKALRSRRPRVGATLSVKRGPESWRKMGLAYAFASVNALQLINVAEAFEGQKVILSTFTILILFYLCFLNGWSRNTLLGWISKWEETPDQG